MSLLARLRFLFTNSNVLLLLLQLLFPNMSKNLTDNNPKGHYPLPMFELRTLRPSRHIFFILPVKELFPLFLLRQFSCGG